MKIVVLSLKFFSSRLPAIFFQLITAFLPNFLKHFDCHYMCDFLPQIIS